jgi:mono/diheme cytochrome c family protein
MFNRVSTFIVTVATGALGAAAVITPFVHAWGQSPVVHAAKPVPGAQASDALARGRYLIATSGCNDCHTAGYMATEGKVPEKDWLTGDALGWQGPWGTTYAPNVRLHFASVDEDAWLVEARTRAFRPPMPSPSLRAMTDDDLRAIYRYVRALGPAGKPAPVSLPPGQHAAGPVVVFPAPPQ